MDLTTISSDWSMWGLVLVGAIVIVVLLLTGAMIIKFTFFEDRGRVDDD
jgi:ATP/ADP translocase